MSRTELNHRQTEQRGVCCFVEEGDQVQGELGDEGDGEGACGYT